MYKRQDINLKKQKMLGNSLSGLSHADVKTVINNAIKSCLINGDQKIVMFDILREAYFFRYHVISDEDEYIRYLIKNGMTHRELQELGFPLRKVQMISKQLRGDDDNGEETSD